MAASGADGIYINNGSVSVSGALLGGDYGMVVSSGTFGGGSITLNALSLDGTTEVAVAPAFTANGYLQISLPPGQYQIAVATATAVYAALSRIPRAR